MSLFDTDSFNRCPSFSLIWLVGIPLSSDSLRRCPYFQLISLIGISLCNWLPQDSMVHPFEELELTLLLTFQWFDVNFPKFQRFPRFQRILLQNNSQALVMGEWHLFPPTYTIINYSWNNCGSCEFEFIEYFCFLTCLLLIRDVPLLE